MYRSLITLFALCAAFHVNGVAAQQVTQEPLGVELSPLEIVESGTTKIVRLPVGKARVVKLPAPVRDVLVATPATAEVIVKTPTVAYLLGNAVGTTNAFFFDADGNEIARLEIRVELDVETVRQAMTELMPDLAIKVTAVDDTLFLSGSVRSPDMAENARQIASRFVTDAANVVNLLSIVEDQQVLLQVRVAEVSRNVLKEVGFNLQNLFTGAINTITSNAVPNLAASLLTTNGTLAPPFARGNFSYTSDSGDILTLTINALERNGLIKTLAEPNLTAISGETANFLAGGEFPVPVPTTDGIAIEFRSFGIGLNFTPVVLNSGRISLRISTEVSALSNEGAITIAGVSVSALTVRRAETTVELPSGGSLIIAGLLSDDLRTGVEGVPWLKDVPILGAFFRNNNIDRTENELVVTVTSYLVRPLERRGLREPIDGVSAPSDFELFFLGRLEGIYVGEAGPKTTTTALRGPIGYIVQ